ncbi:SAM-dependent methyltransferase [Oceanicola sp. 22II-s10i]|uniref:SAM-dependent methyltransferase n=1 Tax=Oceanicola sp. 22II-s10i TaxID=1317116 RepID=UPI000B52593C|nr:class I SAM-dependent methyltransferase [Oceanicola sp. 22II-s10i]OWU83700.1 SAM-dependent methyltransferase [Oceanicola sp. 22II-s10i]
MWEDRYAGAGEYLFGRAPAGVLTENPWVLDGARTALCVADGEGRNSVHLARQGLDVTAFDLSLTAVGRANALAAEAGVTLATHISTWEGWDWSRQFDLVAAIFVQFMTPDARPAQFATLRDAVRPGGRLLLHGYRPEQVDYGTGGPPSRAQMYTPDLLRDHFGDWHIDRLAAYDREVQEGRGHSGPSALIDLVARRPG